MVKIHAISYCKLEPCNLKKIMCLYIHVIQILTWNSSKVGFDCALDDGATQGALPHGGGTVQTADQVTAGQEGSRHILVTADLTDQGLCQTQELLL